MVAPGRPAGIILPMPTASRAADQIRPVAVTRQFTRTPAGSVLWKQGETVVLATASVSRELPPWFKEDRAGGWVTCEYVMLPSSTPSRKPWPKIGHTDSRGTEIQRADLRIGKKHHCQVVHLAGRARGRCGRFLEERAVQVGNELNEGTIPGERRGGLVDDPSGRRTGRMRSQGGGAPGQIGFEGFRLVSEPLEELLGVRHRARPPVLERQRGELAPDFPQPLEGGAVSRPHAVVDGPGELCHGVARAALQEEHGGQGQAPHVLVFWMSAQQAIEALLLGP